MKTALITTTINVPTLLDEYLKQADGKDVSFIVAGDLKTPPAARAYCEERGIAYMGETEQNAFLEPYPELKSYLPWNSVQRRNVAILKAYQDGAECIITIDDDNFCADENYFGMHTFMMNGVAGYFVKTKDEWFNPCQGFYPRGYPLNQRGKEIIHETYEEYQPCRSVVNAGLWLGDPDVDAVTRLALRPDVKSYPVTIPVLKHGTWCPFNSQNTALHRDVIPAYFLSPHVGRFDDIWASYIAQRLTQENGDVISFGRPLVKQVRNPHDLFKDLELEMFGMRHTDDFCEQLRAAKITAKGYKEGCLELLDQIKGEQYAEFVKGYRIWTSLF